MAIDILVHRSSSSNRKWIGRFVLASEAFCEGHGTQPGPGTAGPGGFVQAGRTYLLYSVAGESGIAIAEMHVRT